MKFCPKCGAALVPKRIGKTTRLECPKCGYQEKLTRGEVYKVRERVREEARVRTTSLVAKPVTTAVSEEEKQQRLEEYYDVALELIHEELEGVEPEE
ncbi:MAG: hypothetical protein QXU97_02715 [Fervidicoccaceae archaeon]